MVDDGSKTRLDQKALSYVYRLLASRPRTRKEIIDRLRGRDYNDDSIESVVSHLESIGEVNDLQFARLWIESRLKRHYGQSRIIRELIQKGLTRDQIDQVLGEFECLPDVHVKALIERKINQYKGVDPAVRNRRLFMFLTRRGFDSYTIHRALNYDNDRSD